MDVHAAQHVALADHLQHVHDMGVAVLGRLHRFGPARRRMGAAGEDGQAVLGGGRRHVLAKPLELGSRVADLAVRFRRDLDLGLEKLAADPPRSAALGKLKQRFRRFLGHLQGARIGEEIFLLDAELEQVVRREDTSVFRRHQSADAQAPLVRIEFEFHLGQIPFSIRWVCSQHSRTAICQSLEWPFGVSSPSGSANSRST